ncbi:Monoglyceride lipase [Cyberlindnera fabianii]|uniref:Monoglyceride lipase n=1 Tax=Cyberlindnera fabianii TaxID=36022 RepID=A0A1V2LCZ0_CYBFA|nr:Monoglyceride lipase [Cyberlindnera fabianii]
MAKQSELNPYTPKNPPVEEVVSYNGAKFHTSFWNVPEGVVRKGRVIFVHGFSEYEEVYYWVFDAISAGGYEVFFFDQRGAGHTDPGSTRGYTNEHYVFDDLEFFMERNMKEVGEETKLFMAGHSMGGGIALNYGIKGKHRERLSGIYVTGPLVKLHPDSLPTGLVIALGKMTAKIFPRMKINTDLDIDYITSNEDYKNFILNDPLQVPMVGTLKQLQDMLAR